MHRCDQDRDGKISYVEFTKYLTGKHTHRRCDPYHSPLGSGQSEAEVGREDMTTTNASTYSQPQEGEEERRTSNDTDTEIQSKTPILEDDARICM